LERSCIFVFFLLVAAEPMWFLGASAPIEIVGGIAYGIVVGVIFWFIPNNKYVGTPLLFLHFSFDVDPPSMSNRTNLFSFPENSEKV